MCPGYVALARVLPPGAVGCLHFRTRSARLYPEMIRPDAQWGTSFPVPPLALARLAKLALPALFAFVRHRRASFTGPCPLYRHLSGCRGQPGLLTPCAPARPGCRHPA